jgi:hypothetical protein
MGRVILLLFGIEMGGGWILVSIFGLSPTLAYGVMAGALAVLVAIFLLLTAWSHSD